MRIERIAESEAVRRGAELFDGPVQPAASARFLASAGHHLLFAYSDDGEVIG